MLALSVKQFPTLNLLYCFLPSDTIGFIILNLRSKYYFLLNHRTPHPGLHIYKKISKYKEKQDIMYSMVVNFICLHPPSPCVSG